MKRLIEYDKKLKSFSRVLRKEMTDAERLIWKKIRGRQLNNLQFYRQKPIGQYITDFCCPRARLILEIDGGQHYERKGETDDKIRDDYFKSIGFKVLRFTNLEVLKNIEGVIDKILEEFL